MKLLRFDSRGAFDPNHGVTADQIAEILPQLESIRDQIASPALPDHEAEHHACHRLPGTVLRNYREDPVHSDLARIFHTANRLHDEVDAIAVIASGQEYLGAKALMDSLCHPYHNELSRADRGSKPRMYFEGNSIDNDATRALLERLNAGGCRDDPAESRWAICAINQTGDSIGAMVAVRQFAAALAKQLGPAANEVLPRLVIPVTGNSGHLRKLAEAMRCSELINYPPHVAPGFGIFSTAGLLPAAMLGVDCVQLLEGAIAVSANFTTAAPEDNIVLQYVAVNHLLEQRRDISIRGLAMWSQSLNTIATWHDQMVMESLGNTRSGPTPRSQHYMQGPNNRVLHNVVIEDYRYDPLKLGPAYPEDLPVDEDLFAGRDEDTSATILTEAMEASNLALRDAGRPTTKIVLPWVDPRYVGQLLQMLMLATVVEARLRGNEN